MNALSGQLRMGLTLEEVEHGLGNLPSLPAVVAEIIQSLDNADIDSRQLSELIARDQALVAKLLRLANSSFYGMPGKVMSIADATVVLGLRGVRTLATAIAVSGCFTREQVGDFDLPQFWRHSMAAALFARALASRLHENADEAFTIGLMHDIGRLALASCFPAHFAAVMQYRQDNDCPAQLAEQAVTGVDHAQIGRMLTLRWKFPARVCDVIGAHHLPSQSLNPRLSAVIHVADVLAHAMKPDTDPLEMVPPLQPDCWQLTGLTPAECSQLLAGVQQEHASACEALG